MIVLLWSVALLASAKDGDYAKKRAEKPTNSESPRIMYMVPWAAAEEQSFSKLGWRRDVKMIREPFTRETLARELQLREMFSKHE